MKIAFLGVQGTGKSTLIQEMLKWPTFEGFEESPSVGRTMKLFGFVINEDATSLDQSIALNFHLMNWAKDNLIYARTFMDALVYAKYAYNHNKITKADLDIAESIATLMMPKYDCLFYIKPEFDIVEDCVRSTDVSFRDECASILDEYITKLNLKVTLLSGSVEERLKQISKKLGEGDGNC